MVKQPPVRPPSEAMVGEHLAKTNIAFSGFTISLIEFPFQYYQKLRMKRLDYYNLFFRYFIKAEYFLV